MQHHIDPEAHGANGAAMADAVSTCVHCGFCLAACPTYRELGQETDSPRGRIMLMKEVLEGSLAVDDASPHLDACLGCLACEPACPSGVRYRDLISPFRAAVETQRKRGLAQRIQRTMTQQTLPFPSRFRLAAKLGRLAKPFSRLMPGPLSVMLGLLPERLPPKQTWAQHYPAIGESRARVALLTGCAQSVLDPDINTATIDVLRRAGVDVSVPKAQTCCGALSWHVGNLTQAQRFAIENLRAFGEPASGGNYDAIITNAAGCGSGMHEYHLILKGTQYEARAEAFRHRVVDVSAFLSRLGNLPPIPDRATPLRIAYHDACHLGHAQGIRSEPRQLLRRIPGVQLCEVADAHLCCGSAGTYNVDQPDIAASLGRQKAANVLATQPDIVATGNIGCMNQLANHLTQADRPIPVRHTVQVLRDAYAGNL